MRGVIYARYSSDNQREESIDGQIRECYAFARKNNISVIAEYIDRAFSAKTDRRPDFQRMIKDSAKRGFDLIIVWKLDRFSRNRYDSARHKATLRKYGVKVVSATEAIADGPSGILMESVLEGMAEYYSRELAQKVKRGIRESLIKGNYIGGYILYGYNVENKKYVINEEESAIVRQVFENYANGMKAQEIVDDLNNKGLKTKYGRVWTLNIIAKMLRNSKYIGKCIINEVEYDNVFPPIVDEKIFKQCNDIMDSHKHRQRKEIDDEDIYILSGKLYCGECGYLMTAETGTSSTGVVHRYYKCFGKKKRANNCGKHNVKKDEIENFVFEKTKEYVLQPKTIESIATVVVDKFNSELATNYVLIKLQEELKEKTRAINSMLDAIEKGIYTRSTQERLLKLESTLHDRVIGQSDAVVAISKAIRRARVGLKAPNRPIRTKSNAPIVLNLSNTKQDTTPIKYIKLISCSIQKI